MKKIIGYLFRIIIVLALIAIAILLGFKIYKDVDKIKMYEEETLNISAESQYFIDTITVNLNKIQKQIENDIGTKVELADTGTICKIDLYFVTKVDEQYRYIVAKNIDGVQKFAIAEDEVEDGKYLISYETLGLKDCVFTNIENYIIDKDGNVEYIN